MKRSLYLTILLSSVAATTALADEMKWYRGSTHIHAANPYESYTPETVASWYRTHGYDFVVLTEHEKVFDVSALNGHRDFLVIAGQEITQVISDPSHPQGARHTHVNGLGIRTEIMPLQGSPIPPGVRPNQLTPDRYRKFTQETSPKITASASYLRNVGEIRKQGGVPQINHPNLNWSVRPEDLMELDGPYLLEIANSYPFSNNQGGKTSSGSVALSTEQFWDVLLSRGKVAWGVASDDAHDYTNFDKRDKPTPGKGWVVIRAPALTPDAVKQAFLTGNFYASTGVELKDVKADKQRITLEVANLPQIVPHMIPDPSFRTTFIGRDGRVLQESFGRSVTYEMRGDEGYVRAVVMDSDGRKAWVQPVFLDDRCCRDR